MVQPSQFHVLLLVLVCSLSITGVRGQTNDCTYQMDLTFVVDSSGSICDDKQVRTCDHWKALLAFIHDIVEDMIIGVNDVRVALILYDTEAYIKWNLMAYHDKSELLKAIDKLDFLGYDTNTIAALGNLSTIYRVVNGDRPGIRNTAILITDGKPKMFGVPYKMADIRTAVKKVVDQDIRLLAVGVTDSIDQDTLKELSSPPHTDGETVFFAKDFQSFWRALRQLAKQNCVTSLPRLLRNCFYKMDLAFVVDSSGSICDNKNVKTCENWEALKLFLKTIIDDMISGDKDFRVAMIEYSSTARIQWNLMNYHDKPALLEAINKLPYSGHNTNTIEALGLLSTVFTAENGDRPGVENTAILITDGKPMLNGIPFPMDDIRKAVKKVNDQGTRLLAVGVTNEIDMDTLKELSSPPHKENETVFVAKDYLHLENVLRQLEIQTCENIILDQSPTLAPKLHCSYKMDLAFVVDSSGSICDNKNVKTCENWEALKSFLKTIIDDMISGDKDFRVAMIEYSSTARIQWNLTAYHDKPALLEAIKTLPYSGHNTNTIDALGLLSTVFALGNGDRTGVRNTAILITDGKPMIDGNPTPMYRIREAVKRVNDQGTRLLAVGVTNEIDMDTLKELSSPPHKENETVFVAKDYLNLEKVLRQLEIQTCINI